MYVSLERTPFCYHMYYLLERGAQPSESRSGLFLNSLAPGRLEWYSREIDFKLISIIDGW